MLGERSLNENMIVSLSVMHYPIHSMPRCQQDEAAFGVSWERCSGLRGAGSTRYCIRSLRIPNSDPLMADILILSSKFMGFLTENSSRWLLSTFENRHVC